MAWSDVSSTTTAWSDLLNLGWFESWFLAGWFGTGWEDTLSTTTTWGDV